MNFKPKLVAFDLDGTIAESKSLVTVDMGERLSRLLQKIPTAVMSGAGFPQFERQLLPAIPEGARLEHLYIFPDNAAQCFTYQSGAWSMRYDNAFTMMERDRILQCLKEALEETGLSDVPVRVWGEQIENRGAQITFSGLGQQAPVEEKKMWDPTGEKRERLRAALMKRLPEFSEATGGMTSVDITRKGITKAYGIRKLVEMTGITVSEMLYVGDALEEGGNDYVVVETGVRTQPVFGPEETAKLIEQLLS